MAVSERTDFLLRIGEHIYQDFLHGAWSFDVTNDALSTLTEASDGKIWLQIPENWYESPCADCGHSPQECVCVSVWERRVRALESEGLTRSDAQAVVDAEDAKWGAL